MLRLNMGLKVCPLGKHSQTMRKNFFPRLVFTLASCDFKGMHGFYGAGCFSVGICLRAYN